MEMFYLFFFIIIPMIFMTVVFSGSRHDFIVPMVIAGCTIFTMAHFFGFIQIPLLPEMNIMDQIHIDPGIVATGEGNSGIFIDTNSTSLVANPTYFSNISNGGNIDSLEEENIYDYGDYFDDIESLSDDLFSDEDLGVLP